ncbi:uncharacterized protein LOC129594612 [Paramacrobiotus metropolitanus]|uniref:uncharacterized protein LOC129594612 n=1 Tax=Paramacrobiotus metropolitanus TaxID=2943436 RepID=UPI0024464459|nr:uncharacterized protein LOC129594612 [Paramacrobiotus metropolitanus]
MMATLTSRTADHRTAFIGIMDTNILMNLASTILNSSTYNDDEARKVALETAIVTLCHDHRCILFLPDNVEQETKTNNAKTKTSQAKGVASTDLVLAVLKDQQESSKCLYRLDIDVDNGISVDLSLVRLAQLLHDTVSTAVVLITNDKLLQIFALVNKVTCATCEVNSEEPPTLFYPRMKVDLWDVGAEMEKRFEKVIEDCWDESKLSKDGDPIDILTNALCILDRKKREFSRIQKKYQKLHGQVVTGRPSSTQEELATAQLTWPSAG